MGSLMLKATLVLKNVARSSFMSLRLYEIFFNLFYKMNLN